MKSKRKLHRQWKQGQISGQEYRDAAWLHREGLRKAKVQLEIIWQEMLRITRRVSTGMSASKGRLKKVYPSDEQEW